MGESRKTMALTILKWNPGEHIVKVVFEKPSLQVLVDLFHNKAPSTLIKRSNSLTRMVLKLESRGVRFPISEAEFYLYLDERDAGAPATRLMSLLQSMTFVRYVLGVESIHECIIIRRCFGAASSGKMGLLKQAPPLTVEHVQVLHDVLKSDEDIWNRCFAGAALFVLYSRARWGDAQHSERLEEDKDDSGTTQLVEASVSIHKTSKALHLRNSSSPGGSCFGCGSGAMGRLLDADQE